MRAKTIPMADASHFAENGSGRPILDRTGLTGLYESDTEGWPHDGAAGSALRHSAARRSARHAGPLRRTRFVITDRLGFQLESGKWWVDVCGVGRVGRPGEN